MNTIAERLAEERKRLGLSQTAFASLGGVQKLAQIKYEKGERSPDAKYLEGLKLGGVDVYYVISGLRQGELITREAQLSAAAAVDLVAEVMDRLELQSKLSLGEIKVLVHFALDHNADASALEAFVKDALSLFRPDLSSN